MALGLPRLSVRETDTAATNGTERCFWEAASEPMGNMGPEGQRPYIRRGNVQPPQLRQTSMCVIDDGKAVINPWLFLKPPGTASKAGARAHLLCVSPGSGRGLLVLPHSASLTALGCNVTRRTRLGPCNSLAPLPDRGRQWSFSSRGETIQYQRA